MLNIVIPMAGHGSRFSKAGYEKPKPFIEFHGKPMIIHVLQNLSIPNSRFILITRTEHLKQEEATFSYIREHFNVSIIDINDVTEGPVCTVLYAHRLIHNDEPLLIANSDQIVDISMKDFIDEAHIKKVDGSILTFKDSDPKWSFVRLNEEGYVIETKEKEPISDFATVGIYYFQRGCDFVSASLDMIVRNERVNNEFYVCPVYNYLISQQKTISHYAISKSAMHGTGTPEDLNAYLSFLEENQ